MTQFWLVLVSYDCPLFPGCRNGISPSKGIDTISLCTYCILHPCRNGISPSKGIDTPQAAQSLQAVRSRRNGISPSKGIDTAPQVPQAAPQVLRRNVISPPKGIDTPR